MTLELHIDNQIADIDEDTEVTLTKEFEDDDDSMERKQAEYSYELELPITARNQKIFGYANDIQVKHKFYKPYNAQLYADHILVLDGKFMLTEIDDVSFTGNLYVPSTKDLSDILGSLNLNEIKEHKIALSTLESFRDLNMEVLTATSSKNHYVSFPYILYNFARSNFGDVDGNKYVQLTNIGDTTYEYNNIYPSFNVCKVIEEIFDTYGYKVSGNIFNDKRFTDMWMTASFDKDDYESNLKFPQFLDLRGSYYNVKTNADGTHTESDTNAYYETTHADKFGERYFCDDILHCNNTTLDAHINEHGLFKKSGDQGSIIIKRSGWYQIYFDGLIEIQNNNYISDNYFGENNNFARVMTEIRLVKGNARENTKFFSRFGEAPICPKGSDVDNIGYGYSTELGMTVYGWSAADSSTNVRIPKQGGMSTVHDYSTFDTSNFICGARFGNFMNILDSVLTNNSISYNKTISTITKRNYMYALPNTDNIFRLLYDTNKDDESYMLPLYNFGTAYNYNTAYEKPSVILISENAKCQYKDYISSTYSDSYTYSGHKCKTPFWRWIKDVEIPYYIRPNGARIYNKDAGDVAYFDSSCVYYLEEGDTLNIELLNTLAWKQDSKKGVPMYLYFNLQLGLISTDEKWEPDDNKNTVPYNIGEWSNPQETNINQFLPDMSCNDFLEGFMKTFNLRVTKIAEKEYSINYSDTRQTRLNIVPLDKYYDSSKVTEKSIDIPSTYNWTFEIDESEEGYTTGDDSPFNETETKKKLANELPNYSGSKTIVNQSNTTDDSEDIESRFSYNWYKTVWFTTKSEYERWVDEGKPKLSEWAHKGTIMKVPVIADADVWDKSFSDGQEESDKVSATPRFFYLNNSNNVVINNDDESGVKLMLLTTRNCHNSFELDFDNIPSFVGIEDTFFATDISPTYEIYIEMALSNEDYKRIQENSLIKINGELFRVIKIDGHDVTMQNDADVVLKAMT